MRDRGSLRASPVVLVVLAISLIWISITAHLYQERLESERAAADTTGNLARGFGENVERTIEGVDQVMKVLRNAYAVDPAAFDLTRLVPGNEILNAVTLQIAATDRHGMMTASNLPNATLVDLSDREHIKAQLDTNADELYISIPVFGRVSKQWSLQFTRKMFAQDGSLAGVLIISLDPYYLSRFYGTLEIGKGSITLLGIGDGIVRAHGPATPNDIGRTASDFVMQRIRGDKPSGTFEYTSQLDGVDRIFSYRRLDDHGMAVMVGLAREEVFAQFNADLRTYLAVGLSVTLLVALVGAALVRQRRRLVTSQAQLTATLENIDQGILMIDHDGRTPVINRRAVELLNLPTELLHGDLRHRDILNWQAANGEFGQAEDNDFDVDAVIRGVLTEPLYVRSRPNGTILEVRTKPMEDGGAVRTFTDVTSRRHAEQDLQRAQERLGRAERMEAIGQLTGGVAHDFNNLLAVVVSNLDMLTEETEEGSEPRHMVTVALGAALHGAALVRQLLAFARRLPLEPRTIDLNQLTTDMVSLLSRTLGEAITVTLRKDPRLWPIVADPSQLENAILNLAINARDAMPDGGALRLETSCVTLSAESITELPDASPGDHVVLSVTDTGTGMPPEVLARAFDPFFTTKTDGKGTGLGLSMVYGFTRQSGGHVRIESAPGIGTMVRLYLPRGRETRAVAPARTDRSLSLPRGHESILVVDDNTGVRETATRILQSLGYAVLEAESGVEALEILARTPKLDLLFSDVIMPGGIDGPTLAREATANRPELAVLLTSGYVNTTNDDNELASYPWDLLAKPYRREELAMRVRKALDHHMARAGSL